MHQQLSREWVIVGALVSGMALWGCAPTGTPQSNDNSSQTNDNSSQANDNSTSTNDNGTTATSGSVSTGSAATVVDCSATNDCTGDHRVARCGTLTDDDGTSREVPAPITDGFTNVDIFNNCTGTGDNADFESELTTQVIDQSGTEITAYLFADNYYEFYVNGTFAGRDPVGFTPFNSAAARYQAQYPVTYAVLLVDWEEFIGVGLEERNGFHIGDGGFIAAFSDGNVTSADWKCRMFYAAPLDDASCVVEDVNGIADSSACSSSDTTVACVSNDPENSCQAYHQTLPDNWASPEYDDSNWPSASTYSADDVTNADGFRNYENTLFSGASFIWTSNLNLDNQVVCRATVSQP